MTSWDRPGFKSPSRLYLHRHENAIGAHLPQSSCFNPSTGPTLNVLPIYNKMVMRVFKLRPLMIV